MIPISENKGGFIALAVLLLVIVGILAGIAWGYPQYKIYKQELQGEANYRQAQYEKQIKILDANADLEAGLLTNQKQLNDANTTAAANKIVAGSLDETYIKYLVANKLVDADTQVVYVPTEAGLPVLETTRDIGQGQKQSQNTGSPQAS